jgi:NDP-sugar pyrophosphorylase family protein
MPPALVLTAGLGTRLRPLTLVRAKPAVPIAGEPLVRHIIRWLRGAGISDLVLNLHHLPETITSVVGDGSDLDVRVRYSWEQPTVLGSAGGPRRALPVIGQRAGQRGGGTFLIVNGDTLTDVDLPALIAAHEASDALVTMALVPNDQPQKYGGAVLDAESRVTGFVRAGTRLGAARFGAAASYHFVGVQVAEAAAFDALPDDRPSNSVGDVYDRLIAQQPGSIRGFVTHAAFWDVGTVADYWNSSAALGGSIGARGRNTRVAPSARIESSILWDDVEVGEHAVLEACIVTDGAVVPDGARYRRAVLRAGAPLIAEPFD